MKAGTTETFDCDECAYEFSVTYEPKAAADPKAAKGIEDSSGVNFCPFCGGDVNPDDEDDGEDE